ncbi:MAG: purine-binding chemotaxis protein CheW [Gemmatimonadales bacterium]|nr:purine-binding chemotaxis protein CheW [Gemmatimonadales bacterium]
MSGGEDLQLVVFRVGDQDFALEISQVERILRYEAPVGLPNSPDFLEGFMAHADGMVPVVDLRRRMALDATVDDDTRTMIVEAAEQRIGVVVDRVLEVIRVDVAAIVAPPPLVRGLAAAYIAGMVTYDDTAIVILNAGKFFTTSEQVLLAEVGADE